MSTKPDIDTGWSKEFPQADGDYFYRWRGQRTIYSIALGKVWGALSGTDQHPPLEGAEWLGPFTSSDFEQLIQLRNAVRDAAEREAQLAQMLRRWAEDSPRGPLTEPMMAHAARISKAAAALREALVYGEQS